MRVLLTSLVLLFPLSISFAQDSTISVSVEFYNGGGISTFVFNKQGNLHHAFFTGGPTWRKDTVIRRIQRLSPQLEQQVITEHQRNGEQALLLEQTRRKKDGILTIVIDSYAPVLEVPSSHAVYQIDEQERIITAKIKKGLANQLDYPGGVAVFTYEYGVAGQCIVRDTFMQQVVLEILPRKKRTVVRMMEKRNEGFEYTFGLDGILESKTYRKGGLGKQTEFHVGKNGLKVSGMSFGLSVGGGPSPRALWRSLSIQGKNLRHAVNSKIIKALLESLALQNSNYRRFFPLGFSPAETSREEW